MVPSPGTVGNDQEFWMPVRSVAREEGQDFADGRFLAGSLRQRQVRLDLVAVAAAVFLLDHVPGPARMP